MKTFDRLTQSEVLALAISLGEEDARIYQVLPMACRRVIDLPMGLGAFLVALGGALVFLAGVLTGLS